MSEITIASSILMLQAPQGSPVTTILIYVVGFGLIFWWLILRPQRKMQAKHQEMVTGLQRGNDVMTDGGIVGTIVHLTDDRVTIKTGDTRVVVARPKIARLLTEAPSE